MKIAVIGVGAMGSVYAGLLADGGHEVWAIDLWREHIQAISARGLRVEGASGDQVVRDIRARVDIAEAGACDLYIIATKASGVGAAARAIGPLMHGGSLVLTIQNGLGAGERIATHMPTGNVLLGVAESFGALMKGPEHAHHNVGRPRPSPYPAGSARKGIYSWSRPHYGSCGSTWPLLGSRLGWPSALTERAVGCAKKSICPPLDVGRPFDVDSAGISCPPCLAHPPAPAPRGRARPGRMSIAPIPLPSNGIADRTAR